MADSRKVIPIRPAAGTSDDSALFVSMYQKQATIYPRAVTGWFATWRWVFVWLTQLLFYGLPWLQWGGRQAVLFDLEAQRFYIFGLRSIRVRRVKEDQSFAVRGRAVAA